MSNWTFNKTQKKLTLSKFGDSEREQGSIRKSH
nr:MAG TPA: hypothetical protein [Caudoviricetes sp.]